MKDYEMIPTGPSKGGHIQGIVLDKTGEYIYCSYTTELIKYHISGRRIGSLEYKNDSIGKGILKNLGLETMNPDQFYVVFFDGEKIVWDGMDAAADGIMHAVCLPTVGREYAAHHFGCAGIDGTTIAPLPGDPAGKKYLTVAVAMYGDTTRTDNDYQRVFCYDFADLAAFEAALTTENMPKDGPEPAAMKSVCGTEEIPRRRRGKKRNRGKVTKGGGFMTLREYFEAEGVVLTASLPLEDVPVRLPRLLASVRAPRSVVFAAIPYAAAVPPANLARFARVRDYHAYAASLGEGAVACLRVRYPDLSAAAFADHSPFDEVTGAALAGLGILGDHGLLITKPYSSFVFLFSLVTDLPLAALDAEDIPRGTGEIRFCEHCGACRDACPGSCIGRDRTTCVSAVTQKKADLTEAEEALLRRARTVWGCDVCQNVCPHTKAARPTEIPYFKDHVLGTLTADTVCAMTEEEYRTYAFGWRPREVLLRNLALYEEKNEQEDTL